MTCHPPCTMVTIVKLSPVFRIFSSLDNIDESAPFIVTKTLSVSKNFGSLTLSFKKVKTSDIEAICLLKTRLDLPAVFLIPPKSFMFINLYFHPSSTSSDSVISSPSEGTAICFSTSCR